MQFKGTQGNWRVEQDKDFPTLHNIWGDSKNSFFKNGILIARTCFAPSSEANALLISKAPLLLEALTNLSNAISEGNMEALHEWNFNSKALIKQSTEL